MANKRITDVDYIDSLNSNESFFVNQNSALKQINKENVIFGVSNGGTGAKTAKDARLNLGAVSMDSRVVELIPDGWTDNKQTINVSGVTAQNIVIVAPEPSFDNYDAYIEYNIRCIEQAEGMLIFVCEDVPDVTITINLAIFA